MAQISTTHTRDVIAPLPALLRTDAFWVNAAFFLTFFPSTIYFILPSLSQPVAAVAALPLLFLRPIPKNALTRYILILPAVIAVYMVVSLFIYQEIAQDIIANGLSYMLPPLYLLAMRDRADEISVTAYRWALWLWLIIGTVQYFSLFSPLQAILEPMLRPFIADRFLMTHYADNRGVMFFSSEPSTAAPSILLFLLSALFFRAQGRISRREMLLSIAAALAMAAMNQSGSVAVLLLLAGIGAFLDRIRALHWLRKLLAVLCLILAIGGIGALSLAISSKLRALVVLAQFAQLATQNGQAAHNIILGLSAIGGERVVPLLQGYGSVADHFGVGHGIASWDLGPVVAHVEKVVGISVFDFPNLSSETAVYVPGEGLGQTKPQSFLAVIAWDTGVPGLLSALAVIIVVLLTARRRRRPADHLYLFLLPALLHCALFTQIPLLVPWLLMVFAMTPKPRMSFPTVLVDVRPPEPSKPSNLSTSALLDGTSKGTSLVPISGQWF